LTGIQDERSPFGKVPAIKKGSFIVFVCADFGSLGSGIATGMVGTLVIDSSSVFVLELPSFFKDSGGSSQIIMANPIQSF
jgi:hypothetical protein